MQAIIRILSGVIFLVVSNLANAQEKVVLTTDRDIYIGGETMWFTLMVTDSQTQDASTISQVAYVEILNRNNVPVAQYKCFLTDAQLRSKVVLPDTITTGNYLLRAYTKWMTNFGEESFEKKTISIMNPFAKNSLPKVSENVKSIHHATNNKSNKLCDIGMSKSQFSPRQKVSFSIENTGGQSLRNLTVSVVKSCLVNTDSISQGEHVVKQPEPPYAIPECRGELMRGTISNIETGEAIANEKLMLSFVSNIPVLKFSTSDSLGRFLFEINRFGEQEMVIQPYSNDTSKLIYKVTLDDAYSNLYGDADLPELSLDSLQVKRINEAIINMQINAVYSTDLPQVAFADSIETQESFYGKPEIETVIDRFIELPNVEEIIREIVPYVGLRKKKGQYSFTTFENTSYYPKEGETMVFVDGIPIKAIQSVLEIRPQDIERIEVVNLDYFLEDENLGRILSFYTRQCDLGQMEFDTRLFRQVHQGYVNSYVYAGPDYSRPDQQKSRLADYRNLLYFNSYGRLDNNTATEVSFYTGDELAEYIIIVSGIDANGQLIESKRSFKVQ